MGQALEIQSIESLMSGVAAVPGQKLQLMIGDTLRIKATIQYRGAALNDYFYGAIGNKRLGVFDEIIYKQVAIQFALATTWVSYQLTVDIPLTSAISSGTDYDIYVKIKGHTEAGLPEVDNCIDILGAPEFQSFEITSYEKA